MSTRVYFGDRTGPDRGPVVGVLEPQGLRALPMHGVFSDEPEWGYLGSGPRELALAILLDACIESADLAGALCERFADDVLGRLDRWEPWVLGDAQVSGWATREARLVATRHRLGSDLDVIDLVLSTTPGGRRNAAARDGLGGLG